jgi:hypothetical protein
LDKKDAIGLTKLEYDSTIVRKKKNQDLFS